MAQDSLSVTSPVRGVAVVDLSIGSQSAVPLHWRAGDWSKPPIDLAVSADGYLESLQIVLQDEDASLPSTVQITESLPWTVKVHTEEWPENRYRDAIMPINIRRTDIGELVISLGDEPLIGESHRVSPRLRVIVMHNELRGLLIGPMSIDEWDTVSTANPV
jgi:hypothetical protein